MKVLFLVSLSTFLSRPSEGRVNVHRLKRGSYDRDASAAAEEDSLAAVRELFRYTDTSMSLKRLPLSFSYPPTLAPSLPTVRPIPPTNPPTSPMSPTVAQTNPPTAHPSDELTECETAYAYCPGRSTCFIGNIITTGGGGPWGWSIDLDGLDFSGGSTLTCPVYAGAGQCDFANKGTYVGNLVIAFNSVRWEFDSQVGGQDFHLYSGKCVGNDRGLHLQNNGTCSASDVSSNARTPGQYSLVAGEYDPYLSNFQFDMTNDEGSFRKGFWQSENYTVFPIQNPGRRYLSAHTTVCPCSDSSCTTLSQSSSNVAGATGAGTTSAGNGLSPGATAGVVVAAVVAAAIVAVGLYTFRRKAVVSSANNDSSAGSVSSLSAGAVEGEMETIELGA